MEILNSKDARKIYESIYGSSVCDRTWQRLKKTFTDKFQMTARNVRYLAGMKKYSPRFVETDIIFLENLRKEFGKKTFTGEQIIEYFKTKFNIKVTSATISIWFKSAGGYNRYKSYNFENLQYVLVSAIVYARKCKML